MRVLGNVVHAVSSVFGYQHERLSRPFTIEQQSYMVCLTAAIACCTQWTKCGA